MYPQEVKVVFLGESTVGKTSIIASFASTTKDFLEDQTPTIGACFSLQTVQVNGEDVKLKIWDTAGQERFRALTPMYYRDAQVAILVFAVNAEDSLERLRSWHEDLTRDTRKMPAVIIAANKIDLERTVKTNTGEQFAESIEATYMECSAKTKVGINELFAQAAELAVKSNEAITEQQNKVVQQITAEPPKANQQKKECC